MLKTNSDQAFHELSMITAGLSKFSKMKKPAFNKFWISNPNKVVGVQQSLRTCITVCLTSLKIQSKSFIFQV